MDITPEQFKDTFETNIFGMFFLSQAAVPYLSDNDTIINTTSVTAYRGSGHLIDYASTKGAIVSFTRSLATTLMEKIFELTVWHLVQFIHHSFRLLLMKTK